MGNDVKETQVVGEPIGAAQAQKLLEQVASLLRAGGVSDLSVDVPVVGNANGCEGTCSGGCAVSCEGGCQGCEGGCGGGCKGGSKQTGIELGSRFDVLRDPLVMELLDIALQHRTTLPRP